MCIHIYTDIYGPERGCYVSDFDVGIFYIIGSSSVAETRNRWRYVVHTWALRCMALSGLGHRISIMLGLQGVAESRR